MADLEENNPPKAYPLEDDDEDEHSCIAGAIVIALLFAAVVGAGILFRGTKHTDSRSSYIEKLFIFTYPDLPYEKTSEALNRRVDHLLYNLPKFSGINCSGILACNETAIEKAKEWEIPNFYLVWDLIDLADDKCKKLKQSFVFLNQSLSAEEDEFPIAYGALFIKILNKLVTYMLSSLYRPINVFVFMVDRKASDEFKKRIQLFSKCFSNVIVQITEKPVEWGGHEIAKAVFESVKILTASKFHWKYYQYLSGFTMPLKTNFEMVRIYKELNGSVDVYLDRFDTKRLGEDANGQPKKESDSPMPLFISNLAATFSRETAEIIIYSSKVEQLFEFLKDTVNSDETMWGTILGNPEVLQIPGGFNGTEVLAKIEQLDRKLDRYGDPNETRPNNYTFAPSNYYISRYHIWEGTDEPFSCKGKFVSSSCVFGVADVPILVTRPELVAHKFYFDFERAAYFCLYQNHWKRTLNLETQQKFNATPYGNLALVQLKRGIFVNNVSFYYM